MGLIGRLEHRVACDTGVGPDEFPKRIGNALEITTDGK
jgi:hypothetical protein